MHLVDSIIFNICVSVNGELVYFYQYSGTSDNGHSEEWTTSMQWENCSLPPCLFIVHSFLPPKKGPLNNGQNSHPKRVHYLEVPLYFCV